MVRAAVIGTLDRLGATKHPTPLGQHGLPRRGRTEASSVTWLTRWSFAYPGGG